MKPSSGDVCQFCLANGESEEQCRSHQLKTATGIVSCPILRAFVCPHCKATGDNAHTQSYCPLNKDGKYNITHGASLTELKKKKNAAGRTWKPRSSHHPTDSYPPPKPLVLQPITNCIPGPGVAENSPPAIQVTRQTQDLFWEPASFQLSLYKHYQWLQFYREKCLHHQAQITKLSSHQVDRAVYVRNFISSQPPTFTGTEENNHGFNDLIQKMDNCQLDWDMMNLDKMLSDLREGSEEFQA